MSQGSVRGTLPAGFPEQVQVMPTERCNLRCKHCAVPEEDSPAADELTTEEWRGFIDRMVEQSVRSLVFSGGEALLRPDLLELAEYALAAGIPQVIAVSNLVFTSPDLPHRISALQSRHSGFGIQVSIDGASERTHDWMRGKGAFRALLRNVARLRHEGGRLNGANTVLHSGNIEDLGAIGELVATLGARAWRLFPVAAIGRGVDFASRPLGDAEWRNVFDRLPHLRSSLGLDVLAMGPIFQDDWPEALPDSPSPSCTLPSRLLVGPDGACFVCPPMRHETAGQVRDIRSADDFLAALKRARATHERACPTCKFKLLCVGVDPAHALTLRPERPYAAPA